MFCKYCGSSLAASARFCPNCGAPVPQPAPQPVSQPTPPPFRYTDPAEPKKKSKVWIWIAVIAAVLLIAASFGDSDENADTTTAPSAAAESTAFQEEAPLLNKPGTLTLEYTLTEEQVQAYLADLEAFETMVMTQCEESAVDEAVEKLDADSAYISDQSTVANVLFFTDTQNEDLQQQYVDATDYATEISDATMQTFLRIYQSESPMKDYIFSDWTQEDLRQLQQYTSEVMEILREYTQIKADYNEMDEWEKVTDMAPLYIRQVTVLNRYAQIFGYDNFYECAYEMEYDRDYSTEDIAAVRTYVQTHIAPQMGPAMEQFLALTEDASFLDSTAFYNLYMEDFDSDDHLHRYLSQMPDSTREEMLTMFEEGSSYFTTGSHAMEGAFTTSLDGSPFCYFGPDYADATTVVHELGHYYSAFHTPMDESPLDLSETQSQGNEWLFLAFLSEEVRPGAFELLLQSQVADVMSLLVISTMVDEFESRVYAHPDVASLDMAALEDIWAEVAENYGGLSSLSEMGLSVEDYWKLVVVENPGYYISYGISATAAVNFYTAALEEGLDAATEKYVQLCETPEDTFLSTLKAIGLVSPFDEETYTDLLALLEIS